MKTSDTHAFANQLLICLLVCISVGGSVGLGAVWMRHQISVTANANRRLVARVADIERNCDDTKALIAAAQDRDVIRRRNDEWHLGFSPVKDNHLVRVNEDPVARLMTRNNRELLPADRVLPAFSFTVAVKN
jgi:hypothetical protein